ncbi:MAG: GMC family oxidoreductase [Sandaracinaceae bacterium]|nr:GMC family oxidoreductase [Myxococcales bacterium]MCB9660472.1 GMC family oxidoreductase [Sandaracinaceae bacterium]
MTSATPSSPFTARQQRGLAALCDTFVGPVRPPRERAEDPTGFFARRASELDVAPRVAAHLARALGPADLTATGRLLDGLALLQLERMPQRAREAVVVALRKSSPDAAAGVAGLAALTAFYHYGSVGPDGRNPNWLETGYPGPPPVEVASPTLTPFAPEVNAGAVTLDADVVVVGSGSGGGVVAATLAAGGRSVIVLEAGGFVPEADMPSDDATGFERMYWRGGAQSTVEGTLGVLAGRTLGGGSTINWQNCVQPPEHVRHTWAHEHGLRGLDGAEFQGDLDAVAQRIGITTSCSDVNGVNQRLFDGAAALGLHAYVAARNVDEARYSPHTAGHVAFGDRSGAKLGSLRTWLPDAVTHGARVVVGARVDVVLTAQGRASGVRGRVRVGRDELPLTVRAKTVVVACGALETPALLLRSGMGGPAAGRFLRVHPAPAVFAIYDRVQRGWWGGPMTAVVDEFARVVEGHGYLIEAGHFHPGLTAASFPWASARQHKMVLAQQAYTAGSVAVVRDHGSGCVRLDAAGEAQVSWPGDDPVDRELIVRGVADMIRLHAAAGAKEIYDYALPRPVFRRGDDVERAAAAARDVPLGPGGRVPFCAHQMGSARMGTCSTTSVADPDGQLHGTRGVWVGDTSAFPTAVGANPMWTCMALARRTARAILAAG